MKLKAYLINLKDSVERRETVLTELSKLSLLQVDLVEAVDGKKLTPEKVKQVFDLKKFESIIGHEAFPGEIGCTLSHRKCYQKLLDSDDDIVLILEDDVRFLADHEIGEHILREVYSWIPTTKPCVVTLTRHLLFNKKVEYKVDNYSFHRIIHAWGTCAYFINKKAAEILLKIPKACSVADDFKLMNKKGISVFGIYPMLANGASEMNYIPSEISNGQQLIIEKPKKDYYFRAKRKILIKLGIWKVRQSQF